MAGIPVVDWAWAAAIAAVADLVVRGDCTAELAPDLARDSTRFFSRLILARLALISELISRVYTEEDGQKRKNKKWEKIRTFFLTISSLVAL